MRAVRVENWGLPKTMAMSVLVHAGFLSFGIWGLFGSLSSLPVDAIEVSLGEFTVMTGNLVKKNIRKPVEKSPVDFDTAVKKAVQKDEPQEGQLAPKDGHGGSAVATSGRPLTEWELYQTRLREQIHQALIYPRSCKNLGESGRVTVAFSVLKDGTISDVRVAQPSAFERLNNAALETVKRLARVDPLPEFFASTRWDTFVPIDFALQ